MLSAVTRKEEDTVSVPKAFLKGCRYRRRGEEKNWKWENEKIVPRANVSEAATLGKRSRADDMAQAHWTWVWDNRTHTQNKSQLGMPSSAALGVWTWSEKKSVALKDFKQKNEYNLVCIFLKPF